MISRRSLIRLLPGSVIGGKKVLQDFATKSAEQLALGMPHEAGVEMPMSGGFGSDNTGWALKRLAKLTNPAQEKREREWFKRPSRLDPDLASCQSMSLAVRMHIQADRDYRRHVEQERMYLNGVIDGVWD